MAVSIVAVIPTYNKFVYARNTVLSFFETTPPDSKVILVDDASPLYYRQNWKAWMTGLPAERIIVRHFSTNGGITRAWNLGLSMARELQAIYALAGNSDILFTSGWLEPLTYHLDRDYALVGPLTNAPGTTNKQRQNVDRWLADYEINDDADYLAAVAERLRKAWPVEKIVDMPCNGFCMLSTTLKWWAGAFNKDYVFDPAKKMTGNEDELQTRWWKAGLKFGFVPRSFVFHYRAVSRGPAYKHRGWCRLQSSESSV